MASVRQRPLTRDSLQRAIACPIRKSRLSDPEGGATAVASYLNAQTYSVDDSF
jgi:hypothetical protein